MPRGRTAANQAPLGLSFDGPRHVSIPPEVATPCAAPFDNDSWLFGIDWDGSRAMLEVDHGSVVRLRGLIGDVGDRFPEVVRAASALPPGTTLDGVVSVLGTDGRPDLAALASRIAGSHRTAAVFLATDVVRSQGVSLVGEPYEHRLHQLTTFMSDDSHIQAPEPVVGQGVALATAAHDQGLSAVLARRRDAVYRPGMCSPDRLRIGLSGVVDRVVVGRRDIGGSVDLMLGEVVGGRLTYVHTERLECDAAVRRWFDRVAEQTATPPCHDAASAGPDVRWLRPRLCVTVRDPLRGSQRVIVALRDDVDPAWCVRRQPVPPPESVPVPRRAFTPTVLRALPLDAA